MPWKVTHAKWLQVEADRVEAVVLLPRFRHQAWTPQKLQGQLAEIGLAYSIPECQEINDELHRRGVVEDVAGPPPS